jgi:O-methyltransferase
MRATLDTLGERDRTVFVADSFEGLPKPDGSFPEDRNLDLSWIDYLAVPRETVQANFDRFGLEHGVEFVEGFFEETLPGLTGRTWALVRLDGDTYEATRIALESLYPGLSVGGYLVIDDYQLISECRQAVDDYRGECGIDDPIEPIDDNAARWRRSRSSVTAPRRERVKEGSHRAAKRSVERGPERRIPSREELELRRELESLRQQLGERDERR